MLMETLNCLCLLLGILRIQEHIYSSHAWVYACIRAIALNISQVPVRIQKGTPDNPIDFFPSATDKSSGTQLAQLFEKPNADMTTYQLWEAIATLMNLRGSAAAILDRLTIFEVPKEIWVIDGTLIEPVYSKTSPAIRLAPVSSRNRCVLVRQ